MSEITRRELFRQGTMIAVGLSAPSWLSAVARADLVRAAGGGKPAADTVLVVCQLTGGNDGLNTLVPYADPEYRRLRPMLALKDEEVLKVDGALGFHPSMGAFAELYRKGKVAVVQGVGYPNPNRSHFKSMDIWHSASPDGRLRHGWIGRHFDLAARGGALSPVAGLGLSVEKPMALAAATASIPCFASLADIETMVGDADSERLLRQIQGKDAEPGTATRAVQAANRSALDAMAELKSRLAGFEPRQEYGEDPFGRGFREIARIVASSPATRVVYFSSGGFDTHARQADQHARLLKGFSDAVAAFQAEMEACGRADKVVVLVFSEFGRRAYENGSVGTDHGKASVMFLVGNAVEGGLHGPNPNLTDLDDGDVRHATDFRQVYATALDRWLGSDSAAVLGGSFAPIAVLKS